MVCGESPIDPHNNPIYHRSEDGMLVYLVQHAEAKSESEDPERHLTEEGEGNAQRVAEFLHPLHLQVDAIWHSGKPRAHQTAEILARAISGRHGVLQRAGLG